MVKIKRTLKYFKWCEIECIVNLGSDHYFSLANELSERFEMGNKYFKFWLQSAHLWLPLIDMANPIFLGGT